MDEARLRSERGRLPAERATETQTRRAILAAARRRLASGGREALNISQVARAARLNRGTVYLHFPSREDLLAATLEDVSRDLCSSVFARTDRKATLDPQTWAQRAHELARFAMENPALGQIWLNYLLTSREPSADPFWRLWRKSTRQFMSSGLADRSADMEVLSVTLLAGYFVWPLWIDAHGTAAAKRGEAAARLAREMVRLLRFGAVNPRARV